MAAYLPRVLQLMPTCRAGSGAARGDTLPRALSGDRAPEMLWRPRPNELSGDRAPEQFADHAPTCFTRKSSSEAACRPSSNERLMGLW
eukprot:3063198-Alexandrium_andersonii.AAC.1